MHWISVKERLPKENECVGFTWNGTSLSPNDFYNHNRQKWIMIDHKNRDFDEVPLPITHWMPLPEPPLLSPEDSKSDS